MKVGTGEVFINDSGQVAFWASVSQYQSQPVNWQGVYTGPDILNDRVVVFGDSVLGHAVNHVELLGMNNAGQMLLSVESQSPDTWVGLVVATPNGDYNGNNVVDAADYVVWRKTGINGQQGYNTWCANYGNSISGSGTSTSTAAVPEPSSFVLFVASFAFVPFTARRRHGATAHRTPRHAKSGSSTFKV